MVVISPVVIARQSRPKLQTSAQEREVFRVPERPSDFVGGKGAGAGAVPEIDTADVIRHLCESESTPENSETSEQ